MEMISSLTETPLLALTNDEVLVSKELLRCGVSDELIPEFEQISSPRMYGQAALG